MTSCWPGCRWNCRRAAPDTRHARHLYRVLVSRAIGVGRDEVLASLTAQGIGAGVHYRGVHLHPYYRDRCGLEPASLPVTLDMSERTISLPLGPALTERDQDAVAAALATALGAGASSPGAAAPA